MTSLFCAGILTAVGSLSLTVQDSGSMAFLNWTEPFRLRNDDDTPEVSYCVEIMNGSSSEQPKLDSQCGISDTSFSFTIPPLSWCYLYVAVVTPINIVGRGVQSAVSYFGTETSELVDSAVNMQNILATQGHPRYLEVPPRLCLKIFFSWY